MEKHADRFRPRRLLVAVDRAQHSLEAVRRISEFFDAVDAEINLLYVQKPRRLFSRLRNVSQTRQYDFERQDDAEKVFGAAAAALACQGLILHDRLTAEGEPAREILRCAAKIGADLIVLGSRGRKRLRDLVIGSILHRVKHEAQCPVLIV